MTLAPWKHVAFVTYLVTAIIIFGGFGIWVELVALHLSDTPYSYDGVYTAVATFYPALIGSASFQLLFIPPEDTNKAVTSFVAMLSAVAFICALLLSLFHHQYPIARFFLATFLVIFFYLALDPHRRR